MGALAGGLVQGFAQGKVQQQEMAQQKKLRDAQVKLYELQLEREQKQAKQDEQKQAVLSKFSQPQPLNVNSGMIAAPMMGAGQPAPTGGSLLEQLANASLGDLNALGVDPLEIAKLQQGPKPGRPMAVSPGQTIIDPATGQPLFSLPAAPEKGEKVDPFRGINLPQGMMFKDPQNPGAGIKPIPGFTPPPQEAKGPTIDDIEAKAEYTIQLLDDLIDHPGLSDVVGAPNVLTKWTPGTDAADFRARLDQIQGQQFLEAYQTLKGGGQITQIEGQKAEGAIARMQASQSEEAFKKAATEFQSVIRSGLERARKQAGGKQPDALKVDLTSNPNAVQIRQMYRAGQITAEEARRRIAELQGG